jgi:hypothetical protein
VDPPPPPPPLSSSPENTVNVEESPQRDNNNVSLHPIPPSSIPDTSRASYYLVRRVPILVFDQDLLIQLLQYPWIKKKGSDLEIKIKRDTEGRTEFPLILLLRLKIFSFTHIGLSYDTFLDNLTVQEEASLHISPSYLILTRDNLPSKLMEFIRKPPINRSDLYERPLFIAGLEENVHIRVRNVFKKRIRDVETLIIDMIRYILNITPNSSISYSIISSVKVLDSIQPSIDQLPINTIPLTYESIRVETSELVSCMAHGGIIDNIDTAVECSICNNWLCNYCKDSFLICPGSFGDSIHKFS